MSYLTRILDEQETVRLATRQHWIVPLAAMLRNGAIAATLVVSFRFASTRLSQLVPPSLDLGSAVPSVLAGVAAALAARGPAIEAGCVGGALLALGWTVLSWAACQYVVTNRRILHLIGVLSKTPVLSPLEKINDVQISQSWAGRLLDFGDVHVTTASEHGGIAFPCVTHPLRFVRALEDARRTRADGHTEAAGASCTAEHTPRVGAALEMLQCLYEWDVLSADEYQHKVTDVIGRARPDGGLTAAELH